MTMTRKRLAGIVGRALPVIVAAVLAGPASAQSRSDTVGGEPLRAEGHVKIDNPGALAPADAERIYRDIAAELADFYAMSGDPSAKSYRRWRRHNSAPYLSASHGNRYINNFANAAATRYGRLARGERMAAGAIVAKDGFTVTKEGEVFGGVLALMEKLPAGTSPATGDWRYAEILPDGSFTGDSQGDNAAEVAYCHGCHKARAKTDFLFHVPTAYRQR